METTPMRTISFTLPQADLKLFKGLAKKMGWIVPQTKKGIEKAINDISQGRVYKAENADDLIQQILQ